MSKQQVTYIDHMGDDLSVVNAARVSFDKKSEWVLAACGCSAWNSSECLCGAWDGAHDVLSEKDQNLINYLAKHNHWTPFAHTAITLRMKAPVFVRTQAYKHKAGFVENEVSRRYVDSEPEFYMPDVWRSRPEESVKQGSGGVLVKQLPVCVRYTDAVAACLSAYEQMLNIGVAPEQARMVLPQSMMTEWVWTGNLASFARFCKQRLGSHAQQETRELAQMVADVIEPLFPVSWEALNDNS